MGKRQLAINLISNIIAFGTSLLISFVLTPYLILTIGKEAYSFYPMSNNFVSYLMIITIALNSMASRFITVEIVKKNVEKAKTYYSSVFFANIILMAILSIPMIIVVIFIDSLLNIPINLVSEVRLLFIFVFISMIITVITSVIGIATFAKNRLDFRSGGELFQGLLRVSLFILLFTLFKPSIVFVGVVAVILSITNIIIQIIFKKILLPNFKVSYQYFDFETVKELIASGIWNSINSLGVILLLSVSLLMSNILISSEASGDLSIAQTLPQFISAIITMLSSVFIPRIIHVYAQNDKKGLISEVIFSQKVIGVFSTIPVVLVIIFGRDFFSLWVPSENASELQILSSILIIPLIIHGNMWPVFGLNLALNKVKLPSIVLIVVGLLNIILSFCLVKFLNFGLYIIPLISTIINVVYYFYFVPIYAAKQIDAKKSTFLIPMLKSILFSVAFLFLGLAIKRYIHISSWSDFFLWGALFGVFGLMLHSFLILNKSEFRKIIITLKQYKSRRNKA